MIFSLKKMRNMCNFQRFQKNFNMSSPFFCLSLNDFCIIIFGHCQWQAIAPPKVYSKQLPPMTLVVDPAEISARLQQLEAEKKKNT